MKIDLTCPVELWKTTMPAAGERALKLMMYNLSGKIVTSVELVSVITDKDGNETERVAERIRDLDGRPSSVFRTELALTKPEAAAEAETVIGRIWFADNSVWRQGSYPMTEYTPNDLPNGRKLEHLHYVAGSGAVGFPEDHGDYWLCVCGRPNPGYDDVCGRCRRDRKKVFERYTEDAVERAVAQREQQLLLTTKNARENSSRLQLEREKAYDAKKKKTRRVRNTVIGIAAAALAACAVIFAGIPYLRWHAAQDAMNSGDYAAAEAKYLAMGDYRDAADRAVQARWLGAKAALGTGDEAKLTAARETLTALGGYEDAARAADRAGLEIAELMLAQGGRADEAEALLGTLGGTPEAASLQREADYQQASGLLSARSWDAAKQAFEALGDYKDSADRVKNALLGKGLEAMEDSDPDGAIAAFSEIPGWQDADALLEQAWYAKAEALEADGSAEEAGQAYLKAGAFGDAADKAGALLYGEAEAALAAESYAKAAELYALIPAYEDAQDKYRAAAYAQAKRAMNDTEYAQAEALLNTLPDDYEDVLTLRQESVYRQALAALDAGDWTKAAGGFSRISTYEDSADKLKDARYWLAQTKLDAGDWNAAIALYEQIGSYADADRNLAAARYNYASQLLEGGSYAAAAELYQALGAYRDSADQYRRAVYAQAAQLESGEKWQQAADLFRSVGDYEDAPARAQAAAYTAAGKLEAEGKAGEAAAVYEGLGSYEDADRKARAIRYALAAEEEKAGRVLNAAREYAHAGDYMDAADKAEAFFDTYYGTVSLNAREAMEKGDAALVVTLLKNTDLADLPDTYADLGEIWQEANYTLAEQLYDAGRYYEALPYYRAVPGYKATDERLQKPCYMILGTWTAKDGSVYTFRPDGTCTLDGTDLYFSSDSNAVCTGTDRNDLQRTHSVSSLSESRMKLRVIGSRELTLTRTGEAEVSEAGEARTENVAAPAETPATGTDSYVVTDNE